MKFPFFPYPHMIDGVRHDGFQQSWPTRCGTCDKHCERTATAELQTCRYGFEYQQLQPGVLVAGVLVRDKPAPSAAAKKMRRKHGVRLVRKEDLERARTALAASLPDAVDLVAEREAYVNTHLNSVNIVEALVSELRGDIEAMSARLHDYRAFPQQIKTNIEVALTKHYSGGVPDEIDVLLARALHEEVAIYYTSQQMIDKLDIAMLLEHPDSIGVSSGDPETHLHKLVTKYLKIYQRSFESRSLTVVTDGPSYGRIRGDRKLLQVFPQVFLDNALKYAPVGSKVMVVFYEDRDVIRFSVKSLGPRILPDEEKRVFMPFFRGSVAQRRTEQGNGVGLGVVALVAEKMGFQLDLEQEARASKGDDHWTTFSVTFPRVGL